MRFVYVSDDEESIFWCELKEEATRKEQSFFFGGSKIKCIRCEDIVDIRVGYNASTVLKRHQLPIEFDDLIFSICTKTRTLDLQAKSSDVRNRWVKFLKLIHNELEFKAKLKEEVDVVEEKQKQQRIKFDLEEIWEQDVMTNFSSHWDYINHCPKAAPQSAGRHSNLSGGTTIAMPGRRSLDS